MKIAIHARDGSYSDRFIRYCNINHIDYKLVDCYKSEIMEEMRDCDGLMWHWAHNDYRELLFARQLTYSLELVNKRVWPNSNTAWHFDDKIGQKYLLEAIQSPLIPTYLFFDKNEALYWAKNADYPKVFKLRSGAGSINVHLVYNFEEAKRLIIRAFEKGFSFVDRRSRFKEAFWSLQRDKNWASAKGYLSGMARLFIPTELEKFSHNEKGYVYFQDFIPQQEYDSRLVVVGNRCFGMRRWCRKGDFRASGSGLMSFDPDMFDKESILEAFKISEKLMTQVLYFDFVTLEGKPQLIEISYCSRMEPYDNCPGYWDENLVWHKRDKNLQYYMIEDFLDEIRAAKRQSS